MKNRTPSAIQRSVLALAVLLTLMWCPSQVEAAGCGLCGDVNDDEQVDIIDALFVAQRTVGLIEQLQCEEQADVDSSATADIVDALFIAQYTVGSRAALSCVRAPLQIQISTPANRTITASPNLNVSGTIGENVTGVAVNGVTATISGTSFTASVPLRDGVNMIVAVASDSRGNTGVSSIDVTLDRIAPTVVIDSPSQGFTTTESQIAVTGKVNDLVTGGTTPVVTVNGKTASVQQGSFIALDIPVVPGPNSIVAVARDSVGNQASHSVTIQRQQVVGARPRIVSGDGQQAGVNETLPQPLVVEVVDEAGNPLAGRTVIFEVTANSGALRRATNDTAARKLQVPTNGAGQATVLFTLGNRSGQGNNRVTVSSVGAAGQVVFCASGLGAPPTRILAVNGENQTGLVSSPLPAPFETLVIDRDGNPVAGVPVTFEVLEGNGGFDGQPTRVVQTGDDGLARAVLTLGPDPGLNNNAVKATFSGVPGLPATFIASSLVSGSPEETRFTGVVLDNANSPIPGAKVFIDGTAAETLTDSEGQFLLTGVPVGHIHLRIDPTNSPRPEKFPPLAFETVTVAGQINRLPVGPIRIPPVTSEAKIVGGPEDVTLEMAGVPGLTLTVFKNSARFPDGSPTGLLSISQVHLDKVPMPPPSGTIFMPPAWTVQPAGVEFDPPARITIPNDGLPPGRVIDIFQFDHGLNMFVNVGAGTVTEDASLIVSDPGFGITRTGWGGCGQPQPPNTCASSCDDSNKCTDDSCQNSSCKHDPKTTMATKATNCESCNNGTPVPPMTPSQCCATVSFGGGFVVCCNGNKTSCAGSGFNGTSKGATILRKCVNEHEAEHFNHVECPMGTDECKTTRPPFKPGQDPGQGECDASRVEVSCLQGSSCGGDAACQTDVDNRIVQMKQYGNTNKPGCFP